MCSLTRSHRAIGAGGPRVGATYAYYVDLTFDEEGGGDDVESRIDSMLNNLEVLFQEQLVVLAEDATEHWRKEKGKAIMETEELVLSQPL